MPHTCPIPPWDRGDTQLSDFSAESEQGEGKLPAGVSKGTAAQGHRFGKVLHILSLCGAGLKGLLYLQCLAPFRSEAEFVGSF